jgi:PKD repeat protein
MARPHLLSRFAPALVGLAVLAAGCTTHSQDTPSLSGPSELGTSISISASPDVLAQDGASQSLITINARDNNGSPLRNQTLRVDVASNGVVSDALGTLSARTVVTDANGRATVTFTAPQPIAGTVISQNVEIVVTPLGTNSSNSTPRFATIRLVPNGVIVPPQGSVTPKFTISPAAPNDHEVVVFDGTTSTSTTGTIVQWFWNFGDGDTASGQVAQHIFDSPGLFGVTLTVTDSIGATNSITQSVNVGLGAVPTVDFVISPTQPIIGSPVNFNAAQTKAAPGRTIRSFDWDFGDGSPHASGVQTSHTYATQGGFAVVLTVTDDAGRETAITKTVTVSTDQPTPKIVITPSSPQTNSQAIFDGSTSTAAPGRTIVSYQWTFSDNGAVHTATGPTVTRNVGGTAGTFVVTLTVTDNVGRTGSTAQQYTVTAPAAGGSD